MKHVLFVCVENSCRSQMAEAFGRMYGAEKMNVFSSGSRPSGQVNPKAIAAMAELGYDLGAHDSIGLNQIPKVNYDYVITMGCGDECPFIPATHREDWDLPDPKHMEPAAFNQVRDRIKENVMTLIGKLNPDEG